MNITEQLRESLQEKGNELFPSPDLKSKVMNDFANRKNRNIKRRLLTGVLAAALLIPTSAFAYQSYLADGFYGSFENVKKHIASATMEGYLLFDAKLTQAKGDLGKAEYQEFKELLSVITDAKLSYGDQYGNIDYDQLKPAKYRELKGVLMEIQPYFDKLNGQESSKEVLTSEEYEKYIDSLMVHEKILVQSGINPSDIDTDNIPRSLQSEFFEAREYLEFVNNKQNQ